MGPAGSKPEARPRSRVLASRPPARNWPHRHHASVQDSTGFWLRFRSVGDAPDADCLGSGHSRRGLLLPVARVDPLLADPLHLHLFDTKLLVRSRGSLQGERSEDALGFELVLQYLRLTQHRLPCLTSQVLEHSLVPPARGLPRPQGRNRRAGEPRILGDIRADHRLHPAAEERFEPQMPAVGRSGAEVGP